MVNAGSRKDSSTGWWSDDASLRRWRQGLAYVGCGSEEIARKLDLLFQFCSRQRVAPELLFNECRYAHVSVSKRAFYLAAARAIGMELVLQSFLIHNGINIFDELICLPNTAESIVREQGDQWQPDDVNGSAIKPASKMSA